MTDALLDTTLFIDIRRGGDASADGVWEDIKSGKRRGPFSAVTAYELWVGPGFTREEELLFESMFALLEPVSVSVLSAKLAGQWLRDEPQRVELIFRDALIAAVALERGEPVLTRNQRDFERFPGVQVETY